MAAAATAATAAGPFFGHYAAIALGAVFGALWTISRADGLSFITAGKLFFRAVSVAMVFSTLIAHYLSEWLKYEVHEFLTPVAFFIAWVGDRWIDIRDRVLESAIHLVQALSRRKS